jgi:hypothetical protein
LSATSALGTSTVDAEANVTPAGQAGTSALGTATTTSNNNISVSGLVATSAIGGVGVNGQAVANVPSGVATLGSVSVDVDGEANVTVTGVAGTGALGTATTKTDNRFDSSIVKCDSFIRYSNGRCRGKCNANRRIGYRCS